MPGTKQWYVEEQEQRIPPQTTTPSVSPPVSPPPATAGNAGLSEPQIRAIGAEAGVDSDFVRQTLGLTTPPPVITPTATNAVPSATSEYDYVELAVHIPRVRRLTRKRKTAAVLAPLAYSATTMAILYALVPHPLEIDYSPNVKLANLLIYIFFLYCGPVLAFLLGFILRSKRLGVLSGLLLATSLIGAIGVYLVGSMSDLMWSIRQAPVPYLLFLSGGAGLGLLGATIRQSAPPLFVRVARSIRRRRHQRRMRKLRAE